MDGRLEELLRMLRQANGGGGGHGSDDDSGSASSGSGSSDNSSASSSNSGFVPRGTKSFSELKRQLDIFLEQPERPFRPGDIVMWKEGCSNRKRPKVDEPCVVIEVLPEPLYSQEFVSCIILVVNCFWKWSFFFCCCWTQEICWNTVLPRAYGYCAGHA